MNTPKAKGFSFDRLLTDPMAMFGVLGGMGVLVVGVWMVAGSPGAKDEDGPDGGFQAAPTKSAAGAHAAGAEVGSSLKVAKLKTPGAARPETAEALKDSHASASAGSDGLLHGTLAEIEASQKDKTLETAKVSDVAQNAGTKKPIPVEAAGGAHVPGAAPDSTKLAALPKGNFGPSTNLNNSDFAG
ncbi:MAG: hypothetical protein FD126_2445, partial [Elusimicrobia bacterium]